MVCPVTESVEENDPVLPTRAPYRVLAVRADVEALVRVVCPVTVSVEAVVVESVEVPSAVNLPDEVALPLASTAKLELAVHPLPFQ